MSDAPSRGPLLAAASGLLLGAAFLPLPLGWLAWFAFVPLLVALDRAVRSGERAWRLFRVGYVGGLAFFLVATHWIALLSDVAITVPPLKYVGWLLAAAYLALYWGAGAALTGWLARRGGVPVIATFPIAMLLIEELRGSGELGFPWFQPGYTQHDVAPILQLASLGSVTLVTLWVLVVNSAIVRLVRRRDVASIVLMALSFAGPWAWGASVLRGPPGADGPIIALVQGNIPGEEKWSGRHQQQILETFLSLSDSAMSARPRPTVVIWPETATGSYMRRQVDQALAVASFAHRESVGVFSGYADVAYGPDGRANPQNAAGLFRPDGSTGESYAKRHLVPFGERVPFQWLVPQLGRIDFGQAEWKPGEKTVLFPSAGGPFACLICFESIFPDLARADVRRGARWLVNITNDEWFGNSAALYQHAAMAPFRAVENRVPLARCANTGVTEILDAHGRTRSRAPVFERAVLVGMLPPAGRPTPYTRFGDWPGALALAAALGLALAPALRRRAADGGAR